MLVPSSFFLCFSNISYLIILPIWTIYIHTYGDTNREIICVCVYVNVIYMTLYVIIYNIVNIVMCIYLL